MEDRKEYQIVGTVTIGTDEYRDLIEAMKDAKMEVEEERRRWCEQYHKANKLEGENEELKKKLEKYEEFINSDTIKDKFALFLVNVSN